MNAKKQKPFQETQISFPRCIKHKFFLDLQVQPLGRGREGCWVSLNYPILNFKLACFPCASTQIPACN